MPVSGCPVEDVVKVAEGLRVGWTFKQKDDPDLLRMASVLWPLKAVLIGGKHNKP